MTEQIVAMAQQRRAQLDAILAENRISPDGCPTLTTALLSWATAIAVEVAQEQYETATAIPQGFNTTRSFDTVYLWCTRCPGGTNGTEPLDSMNVGDPEGLSRWFKTMRTHDTPHRQAAMQAALDGGGENLGRAKPPRGGEKAEGAAPQIQFRAYQSPDGPLMEWTDLVVGKSTMIAPWLNSAGRIRLDFRTVQQ